MINYIFLETDYFYTIIDNNYFKSYNITEPNLDFFPSFGYWVLPGFSLEYFVMVAIDIFHLCNFLKQASYEEYIKLKEKHEALQHLQR